VILFVAIAFMVFVLFTGQNYGCNSRFGNISDNSPKNSLNAVF
jgi:hypothetical protein